MHAVVVDKEDCPELPGKDAGEEALSWEEKAGSVLQEESHCEARNPVGSVGGGEEEGGLGEAQVQDDKKRG